MHKINEKASAVLDRLAALVPTAGDRHVLHSKGYMDLHLYRGHSGLLAVAHYFEQNGDLMSDPRMTFWRGPDARWYPVDYELHSLGIRREAILEWTPDDHTCCCCGEATRGRQWHNRDTGFGICPRCVDWILARGKEQPEEILANYGVRGVHYAVEESEA